jgi:hypothetical protein
MADERFLYIAVGVLLMLVGFASSARREYIDGIVCLIAGAGIIANGLRSLLKESPPPESIARTIALSILIAGALALLIIKLWL